MATPLEMHVEEWHQCTRCVLSERRQNVVHLRGSVPCDLLFVGEAPGESEDLLGKPFCGPAGKLLDEIIADGLDNNGHRYAITNLVGCIPRDEDGKKAGEPEDESIRACSDRLLQLVTLCQPQVVVCVGKLASDWIDTRYVKRRVPIDDSIPRVSIIHPAALLRMTDAVRSVNQRRAIITLQTLARQLTPF